MKSFDVNYAKKILSENQIKGTRPRILLLLQLLQAKKPLTIKEIAQKMKRSKIHKVTFYRTLDLLKSEGLVRQLDFGEPTPFYEIADTKNDHHHIVCIKCKKVNDFVGCPAPSLVKKVLKQAKDFTTIKNHSFEFFGLCRKCA